MESGFKGVDAINKRGEDDIGLLVLVIEVLLKATLFWSILVMYFCLMWEVVWGVGFEVRRLRMG